MNKGHCITLQPVAPVNLVLISSERFVNTTSHAAHENNRVPPIWSKNILPISLIFLCLSGSYAV